MTSSYLCHCGNEYSPVHYGDTVLLYLSPEDDSTGAKSGYCLGLKESLIVYPASKEQPVLPNIRSATFKIVAAQNYEAGEKCRKLRETRGDRKALNQAEIDLKHEKRENNDIQNRSAGLVVYYDTKIQLQHVITKKFIAVYTMRPSETEHDKLKVYTRSRNGAECLFKVVRNLTLQCNKIHYCDQLKLESSIIKGYCLDCSKNCLPIDAASITRESYEVNLAANAKSLMTVFPHYYATIHMEQQDTLKGGNTVRLVQQRYRAYIVTDFEVKYYHADDMWPEITIACHVSFKKQAFPRTLSPNKYWQFEICQDPKSGQPLCWDDECHIKHQIAQQYLSVSEDKKVFLIKCTGHHCESTKFKLIPVSEKLSEHVNAVASFHIFHIATETYLQFPDDSSHKLHWQDSSLPIEAVAVQPKYENGFTYEKVDEGVLECKNEIMEILLKLKFNIDHKHFKGVVGSITIIHTFMVNAKNQKLQSFIKIIRNMKVVSMLFQYYKIVRVIESGKKKPMEDFPYGQTRDAIFGFITDYLKRDKKGEQFAILFSTLSITELSSMLCSKKTETLILELIAILVENNQEILTKNIYEDTIKTLIRCWFDRQSLLNKSIKTLPDSMKKVSHRSRVRAVLACSASDVGPQVSQLAPSEVISVKQLSEICSKYLTVLSFFCECNGIPLRNNQEIILEELKLVDRTILNEELENYIKRPWLKDQRCYRLQAAFFKFIVKFYLDNQKLLPAYQSQLLVFQRACEIPGIICWELAEAILTTLISKTDIGQMKHCFVAKSEEDLHNVLQKTIVENYDELRLWIQKEFDGKSVSFSDIPHHFLEKILNVMNLALEVEHAHMLQEFIEKTWRKIPPSDFTDFGNELDSSSKKKFMTDLVQNDLESLLTLCKKIEEYSHGTPQISSMKFLELIDKCYSVEHSIFTKAKSTHLCIARTDLHDGLNYIKSVLHQVKVTEEDKPKFEIYVRNIEEECCQFEKPNAKLARKRNQHIVESSGILSEIMLLLSMNKMDPWWLNSECFKIIIAVSYKNVEIQERFLNHIELFLNHSSHQHYGHQVGQLFSLIFSGCADHKFTLRVKEKYVVFMLWRIFSSRETVKKGAEFTAAILAYMKINPLGLPIQHNQVIVIKNFSSMRENSMSCLKELLKSCSTLRKFIENLIPATRDS